MEVDLRESKEIVGQEMLSSLREVTGSSSQNLVFQVGEQRLEVDPSVGGRIVSFTLGQTEMLLTAAVHPENYGSTFWDAPQLNWDWPPRAVLDSKPYAVLTTEQGIELVSEPDPCGLQFVKQVRPNLARNCFEIDYRMINRSDHSIMVGPWEVTRVEGGLSFFPHEDAPGLPHSALEPVSYQDGICWYAFDASYLHPGQKLYSGACEGWLAHVGPDRTLFVKTFLDTQLQDYAPNQGEVEIWGHHFGLYVELENHGQYRELAPAQAHRYQVDWYLRRVPAEIEIRPGNPDLVRFVRELVGC